MKKQIQILCSVIKRHFQEIMMQSFLLPNPLFRVFRKFLKTGLSIISPAVEGCVTRVSRHMARNGYKKLSDKPPIPELIVMIVKAGYSAFFSDKL